jgi:SAM-dependent methyltransferase
MMTETNNDQIAYWNGDMAGRWLSVEDQLDEFFTNPLAELLRVADAQVGESVLDIGCGGGVSSFAVARQVGPTGKVVGVDVSNAMLERAQQHLAATDLDNVSFLEADAQGHTFEPEQFDLIISRFGVMFFDDPVAAFRNITVGLKPAGRLTMVAWAPIDDNNPWFSIPRDIAVAKLNPPKAPPADPHAPGQFAFADVDRVVGILREAGLADVHGERAELQLEFNHSTDAAAAVTVSVGPAGRMLREANASTEVVATVQRDVAAQFARFAKGGVLRIPATVTLFTAQGG